MLMSPSSEDSQDHPTFLISGGHLTPALATIEYLRKAHPEVRIVFVGREYSQEKEEQLAREREVCEELGIPFYAIDAPKVHRAAWWRNVGEIPKWIPALYDSSKILREEHVDLFLSFGGYVAVPVAAVAKLLRKKVVTHEQTSSSGLANKLIAWFADAVAISHEVSLRHFPAHKTLITGNPLREKVLRTYKRQPSWIPKESKPLLYITGGSQGSQVINNSVAQKLDELTQKFTVIHSCGQSTNHRYLRFLEEETLKLPPKQQEHYLVREWIEEQELSWILQNAVLAISRSGANTTLEFTLHALPAIFIPLPFAHNDEQTKNAETLVEAGAALLLEQKDLTPDSLWEKVQEASRQRGYMHKRAQKLQSVLITNGAENLAELCLSLLRS